MTRVKATRGPGRAILGVLSLIAAFAAPTLAGAETATKTKEDKVLRIPMTTSGPGTLDPIMGSTTYENRAVSCLYETLLQYKYLKRPLELEPLLLAEMPEVTEGGKHWKFRLQPGITFHDDPCFPGGQGREVTAKDVLYSWRRLADPSSRYKSWWLVEGLIKGFNEYKDEQAKRVDAGQKFDYDAPVEGFKVIDDHTFTVELNEPNQQFIWRLAMFQLSVVPREAVEKYGDAFAGHPVGTGPFILRNESDWVRNARMTVHKNPEYRPAQYPDEWMPEDEALGLHTPAGQTIPFVDSIEFTFFVEAQPRWLEFKAGNLDHSTVGQSEFPEAFSQRTKELKRSWSAKGIREVKVPLLDFIFRNFNMEDPLVGWDNGNPKKKALRQAFNLAMDWDEMNETLYNGLAIAYDGPIPPGLDGHPNNTDHRAPYSTRGPNYELARQKLREAGYEVVDGKVVGLPVIDMYTSNGQESVRIVEMMKRNLAEVGIRINERYLDFAPLMEVVDNKKAQFFSFAWGSDYPDAENNLALFYGPNKSPGANHSNYDNPAYNELYEQIRTMPAGPERTAVYEQMRDMLIEDAPFCGSLARIRQYVIQPWCLNFKPTEDFFTYFKYLDVDMDHPDRGK